MEPTRIVIKDVLDDIVIEYANTYEASDAINYSGLRAFIKRNGSLIYKRYQVRRLDDIESTSGKLVWPKVVFYEAYNNRTKELIQHTSVSELEKIVNITHIRRYIREGKETQCGWSFRRIMK